MAERTGIILAGGASRRMGTPKAWVQVGGKPLIVRAVESLRLVCDELVIVANDLLPFENLGIRLVGDIIPGKGSLGGIYSGLASASANHAFVCACDMPFLNPSLIEYMFELTTDHDVVIPSVPTDRRAPHAEKKGEPRKQTTAKDRNLHPLHAVYSKDCLDPIRQAIERDDLRMISFHDSLRIRILDTNELARFDPQQLSLLNVNTPQDLQFAQGMVTPLDRV